MTRKPSAALSPPRCRRGQARFPIDGDRRGSVRFDYPEPGGEPCEVRLRDLSRCGLSFVLSRELPGFEVGTTLNRVSVRVGAREMRGDLLVMHLTPDCAEGCVCGALFYPARDSDILALRATLDELAAPEPARAG